MTKYFKPAPTTDKRNYAVVRRSISGNLYHDQLPQEGLYTEQEMAKIVTPVPGEWVELPRNKVGFIFGLRQVLKG